MNQGCPHRAARQLRVRISEKHALFFSLKLKIKDKFLNFC